MLMKKAEKPAPDFNKAMGTYSDKIKASQFNQTGMLILKNGTMFLKNAEIPMPSDLNMLTGFCVSKLIISSGIKSSFLFVPHKLLCSDLFLIFT